MIDNSKKRIIREFANIDWYTYSGDEQFHIYVKKTRDYGAIVEDSSGVFIFGSRWVDLKIDHCYVIPVLLVSINNNIIVFKIAETGPIYDITEKKILQ